MPHISQFWYLAFENFNYMKPHTNFRFTEHAPLDNLKSKLNNLLPYLNNKKVSIDNEGKVKFYNYEILIEVYATVVRSIDNIIKMLKRLESSSHVKVMFMLCYC